MLEILRNSKDSWIVKISLGLMALTFIFFFGSKTLRNDDGSHFSSTPATVNGVDVNPQKANFIIDSQMDNLREQFKGEVPANFAQMLRQNVVTSLVNSELISQDAKRMGFGTAPAELKDHIKNDPQFQENGQFNRDFYLEKFRPWYQLTRGTSYENDARDGLATDKISGLFEAALSPSTAFLNRAHKIENTKRKFSVIKIRVKPEEGDMLPKTLEADKTAEETGKADQKELADKVFAAWKSGAKMDDLLKDNKLKINDTAELGAARLPSVLDGKDDFDALKKLLALSPLSPFPESYFDEGTYYYLIKLADLKTAEAEPSADVSERLKGEYRESVVRNLESAWIQDLTSQGKVTYKQPE
jgi:hypothetical protein